MGLDLVSSSQCQAGTLRDTWNSAHEKLSLPQEGVMDEPEAETAASKAVGESMALSVQLSSFNKARCPASEELSLHLHL